MPYIMAAKTAGIDRNEEITSLSTYVYTQPQYYCGELAQFHSQLEKSERISSGPSSGRIGLV